MRPLVCVFLLSTAWAGSALAAPRPVEPSPAVAAPPPPRPYPYRSPSPYPPPSSGRFAAPPPGDPPPDDGPSPVTVKPAPVGSAPAEYQRPRRRGHLPSGWLLPVGFNVGGVTRSGEDGVGFLVGGEVSVVKFPLADTFWAGAYVDALYDHRGSQVRFSAGPEMGWTLLGLDAGVYGALGDQHSGWGLAVRGMLTLGVCIPYVRVGFPMESAQRDPRFVEFGALLKLPIELVPD